MADPGSARQQNPPLASSNHVRSSSSKPPLRTYSKRALQDTSNPPSKRQRIELPTIPVQSTTKSGVQPSTPTLLKNRSISRYFRPVTEKGPISSPQSSIFSSDPAQENVESPPPSPPSSPPSLCTSPSPARPKKRARRRLTARQPLALFKMSEINVRDSTECKTHEDKPSHKGLLHPESPLGTSSLGNKSPSGLEQEGDDPGGRVKLRHDRDDIPRSDPIDIPGARAHTRSSQDLVIPFAPHHPYTFRGPALPSPSPLAANRQFTFNSDNTYFEGSTPDSERVLSSVDTMVAGASTRPQIGLSFQSDEDLPRRDMLLMSQPSDPDMILMSDFLTRHNPIQVPGAISQLTGVRARIPANIANSGTSQFHVASPSAAQISANSAVAGVVQPNVPAARNAQGSSNLVQSQLDLGRPTNLTCGVCRFAFNRTLPADVRAHNEYHDAHTLGEPVINLTTSHRHHLKSIDTRIGQGDYVIMVDRSSTDGWKNLALTVLERHVDKELGSSAISPSVLWSSIADPAATGPTSGVAQVDRFKVYMYVRRYVPKEGRVVSLLLAERITTGFETNHIQIEADEFGLWPSIVPSAPPVVSTKAHEAVLGVNKFWTIKSSRRNGYGKILLDEARYSFVRSYIIPRVHVAWTCTTKDGARFAREYLQGQADYEYLTYEENS